MVGFWEKYGLEGKGNSSKPKKEQKDEQLTPAKTKNNSDDKDKSDKKHRTTNKLSELAEILEEAKNETDTPKAEVVEKTKEEKGEETMDNQKITQEMREGLNALGMDDETINGLSYDVASDILRDKDEISKKLDNITDNQKITQEMREGLNALGMDDETINALKFNEALGILRDKDEISKKLDELSIAANKKPEEIIVREQDTPPQPTPAEHTDMHWIDEKIRDYSKMKEHGNATIKSFTPDKAAGTFTAEIDNGTITYTSPNEVSVTKDSSYKVFETMMREDSNAGKAIRIPEDASEEFKTNLFVAAVLNGHKVNGAEDLTLDAATLDKIGLTAEQREQLKAALPNAQKEATPERMQEEKNLTSNEPLPGPYNPAQHTTPVQEKISHILSRKNMINALANGEAESLKPTNPDKPTYTFRNPNQGESR